MIEMLMVESLVCDEVVPWSSLLFCNWKRAVEMGWLFGFVDLEWLGLWLIEWEVFLAVRWRLGLKAKARW